MLDLFNGNNGAFLGMQLLNSANGGGFNNNRNDPGSMLMQLAMSGMLRRPQQATPDNGINMQTPGYQATPQIPQPNNQDINATPSLPDFSSEPAKILQGLGYTDPEILKSVPSIASKIGSFESGNRYNAMGPPTSSGDRAYGKYQVMGNNIPSWTKEVLGKQMTPQQFLSDPSAQDAVAFAKMAQSYKKYGTPQDVASVWFSGRPFNNNNRRDVLGTSVPQYIRNTVGY